MPIIEIEIKANDKGATRTLIEVDAANERLANTLKNKLALAASEAQAASARLTAAQEKLANTNAPEEQAKLALEVNRAKVALDSAHEQADKYTDELHKLDKAAAGVSQSQAKATISLTELKSGLDLAGQGLEFLKAGLEATVLKAAEWGDEMGDLAQVTGGTVSETSKMAATLELMGIESGNLTTTIKALTKNGLQLNMDTLVQLSREYQAIQDPVEQNEFLFKKFGKAGLDLAEVMGKDAETLRRLGIEAEHSGKVLDEQAAEKAEKLNLELAILKQKAEGAAIAIGTALVPAVLDFVDTQDAAKGSMLAAYGIQQQIVKTTGVQSQTVSEYTSNLKDLDLSLQSVTQTEIDQKIALEENRSAVERLTGLMGGAVGNELRSFSEKQTELKDKAEEYRLKIEELEKKPYLTSAQKEQLEETKTKLGEVNTELDKNATAHENAMRRIVFSMLQGQLATDGFTTQEVSALTTVAEKWGLIDPATKAATDAISQALSDAATNDNWDNLAGEVDNITNKLLGIPTKINSTVTVTFLQNGTPNPALGDVGLPGGDTGVYNPTPTQEIIPVSGARADGGSVYSGHPYWVGERGPEPFIPAMNGRILSVSQAQQALAGGTTGAPITINVNGAGDPRTVAVEVRRQLEMMGNRVDSRNRMGV